MGVMAADERQVLNAHGAKRLPSVEVDSYNLEIKDEDGFVGDKASRGAFHEMLEKWREPLRKLGADPLGEKSSDQMSKKQLDKLLAEGDPEAGGIIHSAIEEFAQALTSVIKRFLKVSSWKRHRGHRHRRRLSLEPHRRARGRAHRGAAEIRRLQDRAGAHPKPSGRGRPHRRRAPDAVVDAAGPRRRSSPSTSAARTSGSASSRRS